METVRDFIGKISADEFYGDDVKVLIGKDRDVFINNYLVKMRTLLESRFKGIKKNEEIEQIINFLADNLNRNVKYVIDVTYTDEEQEIWLNYGNVNANERKEFEQNEIYKRCKAKHDVGAGPGGYIQGRIIYSNLFKDEEEAEILKAHETTHAARCVIVGRETQKSVIQDCDIFDGQELRINGNPDYIANTYENVFATAGYDKMEVLERGNIVEGPNDKQLTDLMETCTEAIADMMCFHDDRRVKKFQNLWIPTNEMKMSAIDYDRHMRDCLIMAIGSDEFIFDMLKKDSDEGLNKLNQKMQQYKANSSIIEYLNFAREYSKCLSRIESGNQNDIYNEKTLHLFFEKMESYTTDIFLSRMENCLDVDKNEQIEYYLSILQTEQAKNRISQRLTGKNGLDDCLDDESLRISTEQEATKVVKETVLGKDKSIEGTEQQK